MQTSRANLFPVNEWELVKDDIVLFQLLQRKLFPIIYSLFIISQTSIIASVLQHPSGLRHVPMELIVAFSFHVFISLGCEQPRINIGFGSFGRNTRLLRAFPHYSQFDWGKAAGDQNHSRSVWWGDYFTRSFTEKNCFLNDTSAAAVTLCVLQRQ